MRAAIPIILIICLTFGNSVAQVMHREVLQSAINNSLFIPGEDLKVAIQVLHPDTPFEISQVAYIQLVDEKKEIKIQEKVQLKNGQGSAIIFLPSHLKTGNYVLLVFTKWMKNEGIGGLKKHQVTIINPFDPIPKNIFFQEQSYDSLRIEASVSQKISQISSDTFLIDFNIRNERNCLLTGAVKISNESGETLFSEENCSGSGKFRTPALGNYYTATIVSPAGDIHFKKFIIKADAKSKESDILKTPALPKINDLNLEGLQSIYGKRDSVSLAINAPYEGIATIIVRKKSPIKILETLPTPQINSSITQSQDEKRNHLPDFRGEVIEGYIRNSAENSNATTAFFITGLGNEVITRKVEPDKAGHFAICIDQTYDLSELIFSELNNHELELISPFSEDMSSLDIPPLVLDSTGFNKWTLSQAQYVQIMNIYDDFPKTQNQGYHMYSHLEHVEYRFDDYTRFSTMSDQVIEIMPELVAKKSPNGFEFSIRNIPNKTGENSQVYTTLNGVKCSANDILNFDPKRIEMVEIYQQQFQMGSETFAGAVNFITFREDGLKPTELEGWKIVKHQKFSQTEEKMIVHQARIPDFRTELLWIPHYQASSMNMLTFTTSDVSGDFEILIFGKSENAQINQVFEFTVK